MSEQEQVQDQETHEASDSETVDLNEMTAKELLKFGESNILKCHPVIHDAR